MYNMAHRAQLQGCPMDPTLCGSCGFCSIAKLTCTRNGTSFQDYRDNFALRQERERRNDLARSRDVKKKADALDQELTGNRRHTFCTVNYPHERSLPEMMSIMQNHSSHSAFAEGGYFCLEYHTSGSNHPHIHMVLHRKLSPSKAIRTFSRMFFKGHDAHPGVHCKAHEQVDSKYVANVAYVQGTADSKSSALVEADDLLRNSLGLERYYNLPL